MRLSRRWCAGTWISRICSLATTTMRSMCSAAERKNGAMSSSFRACIQGPRRLHSRQARSAMQPLDPHHSHAAPRQRAGRTHGCNLPQRVASLHRQQGRVVLVANLQQGCRKLRCWMRHLHRRPRSPSPPTNLGHKLGAAQVLLDLVQRPAAAHQAQRRTAVCMACRGRGGRLAAPPTLCVRAALRSRPARACPLGRPRRLRPPTRGGGPGRGSGHSALAVHP